MPDNPAGLVHGTVTVELLIGIRAELRGRDLIRRTLIGAVLGPLVIALRVVLH